MSATPERRPSLLRRLARRLRATVFPAPPPPPPSPPVPAFHAEVRRDLDWDRLARESATRFERVYYGHGRRPMFKWAHYLPLYDRALAPFVGRPVTVVEIGLAYGGSLQLWRDYLGPQIRLIGVDIDPVARTFEEPGVEVLIGDQGDPAFLQMLARHVGQADIVIDDGSHRVDHQILTFEALFPILRDGGVYVCEDLHTSYWPSYGGGLGQAGTFVEYAKSMVDKLHYKYGIAHLDEHDLSRRVGAITVADSLMIFDKAPERGVMMAWVGREEPSD